MKHLNLIILFVLIFNNVYKSTAQTNEILITEVMSCNESALEDAFGNNSDWIEIYNNTNATIDLSNYYLSDDEDEMQKWNFPSISLQAGDYKILFASKKDSLINNEVHTNFKLSSSGECLFLSDNANLVDNICFPALLCNQSYGKENNTTNNNVLFFESSPGNSNEEGSIDLPISFSHTAGFYEDSFELVLNTAPGFEIRYTTDGSKPNENSTLYESPILIKSRIGDPNVYAEIQSSPVNLWANPLENVFKINVINAKVFLNNIPFSRSHAKTYLVDEAGADKYTLPVVSIIAEPNALFSDSTGIYVPGITYDEVNGGWTGNYYYDWSRDIHLEYFDADGSLLLNQNAELEISGQSTRQRRQKSLKLKAEGNMAVKKFDYPFFNTLDDYETLVLDSPFSEYRRSMMRDAVIAEMSEPLAFGNLDSKPLVVFINGEYWGLHTLLEKQTDTYIKDHYGYDDDEINFVQIKAENNNDIIEGDNIEYLALRDYVTLNDLSIQANYDYVASQINIENFIDYNLFEIFLANNDWPTNNFKVWRPIDHSRKWEWLPFDFDACFIYAYSYTFGNADDTDNDNLLWSVIFLKKLLENDDFKQQFLDRFQALMSNEFCYDNLAQIITKYYKLLLPEYEEHLQRWNYTADDDEDYIYNWLSEVERYFNFAHIRAEHLQGHVEDRYGYDVSICAVDTFDVFNAVYEFACNQFVFNDSIYTASTIIPSDTNISYLGNDSIVDIQLFINEIDLSYTVDSTSISLNEQYGSIQWVDCNDNMAPINGANETIFLPEQSGNYAAIIESNGCSEIIPCIAFELLQEAFCNNPCYTEYNPIANGVVDNSLCNNPLTCADNPQANCLATVFCNDNDPCTLAETEIIITETGEVCTSCLNGQEISPECNDPIATNYNPNALCSDNSSCEYIYYCNNPCYAEYDPTILGSPDDSMCLTPLTCADNPQQSCISLVECDDLNDCTANEFESKITITGEVCIVCGNGQELTPACGDPNATNYNSTATCIDNGLCSYENYCNMPCYAEYNPTAFGNPDNDLCVIALSCADNPEASCLNTVICNDNNDCTINEEQTTITLTGEVCVPCGGGELLEPACGDVNANNYNPDSNCIDNGLCTYSFYCNNPCYAEYNPITNGLVDDSLCQTPLSCADNPLNECLVLNMCDEGANQYEITIVETGAVCSSCLTFVDEELWKAKLSIYPNPANNFVNISLNDVSLIGKVDVSIINIGSQIVYQTVLTNQAQSINVSDFAAGVYLLRFKNEHQFYTKKLIIQ